MAEDIKRLNYFTGQFLEALDFEDEQKYHIDMRRRLNRLLYSPGVVDIGFDVTKVGEKRIKVGAGFAIDKEGRELVIIVPQGKDVTGFAAGASVYVALHYDDPKEDERTKENITGFIRITERPEIKLLSALPSGNDVGLDIPIAKLQLDTNGNIQPTIDTSVVRQLANVIMRGGKVGIGTVDPKSTLSVKGGLAVGASYAGTKAAPANGLLVEGNVGIGTASPGAKLEVANQPLDDTAFQPLIRLLTNQKEESPSNAFNETKPSYGIEFLRQWSSQETRVQAGIYAWATRNFGSGLAFRTRLPGSHLSTRMVITDLGNVGMGKLEPGAKLEVAVDDANTKPLVVGKGTTNYLTMLNDGNVGIGTTSPGAKLEVAIAAANADTKPLVVGKGTTNYLTMLNNGNVGIGATAPAATLQIGETITVRNDYDLSTSKLLVCAKDHNGGMTPFATQSVLALVREGVAGQAFGNMVDFRLGRWEHPNSAVARTQLDIYLTEDAFVPKPVMSLRANGNVGIGTTDPKSTLSVAGGLAVGATYAKTNMAPANGLLVEGNVGIGIGTTNPAAKLEVAGEIKFSGEGLKTDFLGKITPFYLRGTGSNNSSARTLIIGSTTVYDTATASGRGLTLTIMNKSDHKSVSTDTYDTYDYGRGAVASDKLATALNGITKTHIGILTSFDAWEWQMTPSLKNAFYRVGLYKAAATPADSHDQGGRRPYAAIFEASSSSKENTSKAVEVLYSNDKDAPFAEICGWLIDGSFIATGVSGGGSILEQLDVIATKNQDDWTNKDHPIVKYFIEKLRGKPTGTLMRAYQDRTEWSGFYFEAWVSSSSKIKVTDNRNTGEPSEFSI